MPEKFSSVGYSPTAMGKPVHTPKPPVKGMPSKVKPKEAMESEREIKTNNHAISMMDNGHAGKKNTIMQKQLEAIGTGKYSRSNKAKIGGAS